MTYQLKRIDPYWKSNPLIVIGVVIGVACALVGAKMQAVPFSILGGVVAGVAVLLATRPAVSAILVSLGLVGGFITFVLLPNQQAATMSLVQKLLSTVLFGVFYMVLMDALVLVLVVLYNFFTSAVGLGGLSLELEAEGETSSLEQV
ncbi:MAG: hypothetical protein HY927_10250 [Elusimicrobia bacterium]|nr:hypothetical protein [Elusimicrobiota bacterium]